MAGNLQCAIVRPLLSDYIDEVLDPVTQLQVAQHIASCTTCYAEFHELLSIDVDNLIRTMPDFPIPATQRQRLFGALDVQPDPVSPSFIRPITNPRIVAPSRSRSTGRLSRILPIASVVVVVAIIAAVITTIRIQANSTTGFVACPTIHADKQSHVATRQNQQLLNDTRRLTCDPHITVGQLWQVSPDGHWIAYVNDLNNTVHIVSSTATNDHAVTVNNGTITTLSWSPASTSLAIIERINGQLSLWISGLNGNATQNSDTIFAQRVGASPMWSQDSVSVAWSTISADNSETIATANLEKRTFSHFPITGHIGVAQWVGGSQHFLAWSTVQGNDTIALNLWQIDTNVITTNISSSAVAISSVTGKFAYARHDGIIIGNDYQTGKETPLAQLGTVSQLFWSPDGTMLLAVSNQSLWLVMSNKLVRLANYDARSIFIWSPDSQILAYLAEGQIHLLNRTGTDIQFTSTSDIGEIDLLSWSPDSAQLLIGGSLHNGIVLSQANSVMTLLPSKASEQPQWIIIR